jgi:phosphoribosylanthranilate isomerase
MSLRTLVKVGSISNLTDARYCAGMGAELLGFQVVPGQPQFIEAKHFQEIRGWVTGPQVVAEIYGMQDIVELSQVIEHYRPDYLELSLKEWERIGAHVTLPFIFRLSEDQAFPPSLPAPAYIIADPHASHLERIIPQYDVLIAVRDEADLNKAMAMTGITGVALSGSEEIRPGLKNFDSLSAILEALETDD